MRFFKTLTRLTSLTLQGILLAFGLTIGAVWLLGRYGIISPITPFVVQSGSMSPAIAIGSVVLVQPKPWGYAPGDIITYSKGGKEYTTHRVTGLVDDQGGIAYQTQGDANDTADPGQVGKSQVKGAVILSVPYIGYAVAYAKKPYGFILLVIIPATIIIYEELRNLGSESKKLLTKKTKPTQKSPSPAGGSSGPLQPSTPVTRPVIPAAALVSPALFSPPQPPPQAYPPLNLGLAHFHADRLPAIPHPVSNIRPEVPVSVPPPPVPTRRYNAPTPPARKSSYTHVYGGYIKLTILIPFAATALLLVGMTNAFFTDTEISTGNILGAGTWSEATLTRSDAPPDGASPTPTPSDAPPAAASPTPTPSDAPPAGASPTSTIAPEI